LEWLEQTLGQECLDGLSCAHAITTLNCSPVPVPCRMAPLSRSRSSRDQIAWAAWLGVARAPLSFMARNRGACGNAASAMDVACGNESVNGSVNAEEPRLAQMTRETAATSTL
jgi:hypothetical protein